MSVRVHGSSTTEISSFETPSMRRKLELKLKQKTSAEFETVFRGSAACEPETTIIK